MTTVTSTWKVGDVVTIAPYKDDTLYVIKKLTGRFATAYVYPGDDIRNSKRRMIHTRHLVLVSRPSPERVKTNLTVGQDVLLTNDETNYVITALYDFYARIQAKTDDGQVSKGYRLVRMRDLTPVKYVHRENLTPNG